MSDLKMPNVNHVIVAARLTRDPELKYLPSGQAICKMGLAISSFYTQDGERKEQVTFVNAVAWSKLAEYCGQYLKKGRPVLVEGSLRSNEWDDKTTGQKRSTVEITARSIQALDWDGDSKGTTQTQSAPPSKVDRMAESVPEPDDDLPF